MSRLLPPTDDHPASMLRWARQLDIVMIPVGVAIALVMRAEDLGAWWIGLVVSGMALVGLATIGPSIRKAEARGPNDPATKPERMRRAMWLTALIFGVPTVAGLVVALIIGDAVLVITFAIVLVSGALGLALVPRVVGR